MFGYVKIGAAVPQLKLADCISNKEEILKLIREANEKGIRVLTFPELALGWATYNGDHMSMYGLKIGVEICEDLWVPIPPSSYQSLYGATLLLNASASNELAGKPQYRHQLVAQQSSRCLAAYVYAAAGIGESTQDAVFSGHSLIC